MTNETFLNLYFLLLKGFSIKKYENNEKIIIMVINSKFEIVDIYFDATPFNKRLIRSQKRAKFVLELNAGIFKKLGFNIGDSIKFKKNKKIVLKNLNLN